MEVIPMRLCDEKSVVEPLRALRKNWDSYGGEPITPQVMALLRNGNVCPTPSGGVSFEWHIHGWDVEVVFAPDGTPEFLSMERTHQAETTAVKDGSLGPDETVDGGGSVP